MGQCTSTTWVAPTVQLRCEERDGHYPRTRTQKGTRHRYYFDDRLDTEVTWEDPLPEDRRT